MTAQLLDIIQRLSKEVQALSLRVPSPPMWGTVEAVTPFQVRPDGPDAGVVHATNAVGPIAVGARVFMQMQGRQLVAYGPIADTGWTDFSWSDPAYINNPAQSAYTLNQWRIKANVLTVALGFGASAPLNSAAEIEIAHVPIKNAFPQGALSRLWQGGVGGSGAMYGFIAHQHPEHISFHIKGHTSSMGSVAPWASTTFTIPLDDDWHAL